MRTTGSNFEKYFSKYRHGFGLPIIEFFVNPHLPRPGKKDRMG
jgi:hypothetical protein